MRLVKVSGIALLEVLISLVVISVGLLGLAALQISSMQDTQQTRYYEAASYGLAQLLDRMSTNGVGTHQNYYDFDNLSVDNKDKTPDDGCNGSDTSACIAKRELANWLQQTSAGLPDARVKISTANAASGAQVTAKIVWNAALSSATATTDYTTACDKTKVTSYQCSQITFWVPQ